MNDVTGEFYAIAGEGEMIEVRRAADQMIVAVIPLDLGDKAERWSMATKISAALCRNELIRQVLTENAITFREYQQHHDAEARKLNPGGSGRSEPGRAYDRRVKAKRNADMAQKTEDALRMIPA